MLDNFYTQVNEVSTSLTELSEEEKAVVLIRVAIERSSREMGIAPAMHLISTLLTHTLGVVADAENQPDEDLLGEIEVENMTSH